MGEENRDGSCIKAEIDTVEDGTDHRNSELEFVHRGSIGGKDGDDMAFLDANGRKGGSDSKTSTISLGPGVGDGVVDDGGRISIDERSSFKETNWS